MASAGRPWGCGLDPSTESDQAQGSLQEGCRVALCRFQNRASGRGSFRPK